MISPRRRPMFPDAVSLRDLYEVIAPDVIIVADPETGKPVQALDNHGRCICTYCLHERHELCHQLSQRYQDICAEYQWETCPQKIARNLEMQEQQLKDQKRIEKLRKKTAKEKIDQYVKRRKTKDDDDDQEKSPCRP